MDEDFVGTVAAVLLPFPILLGLVALIHFGWRQSRGPQMVAASPSNRDRGK